MSRAIRTFRALPAADRRLLFEAFLYMVVAVVLVRLVPFKRWAGWLGIPEETPSAPLSSDQLQRARRVKWAVEALQRRLPWHSTCLMNAFAAQRLLVRQGVPHRLVLGVRFEDTPDRKMAAHAWVTVGPAVLIGEGIHRDYKPIAIFSR